ncbi:MAG TPA: glycosyltransferase family 1 protein [Iamia sp.]|nr:glycosyltransferase family 1 protein [Iamia sp.]
MSERRIRVGVNLLWLVPGVVGGSEEYVTRLLRALADLDPPDLEVQLFGLDELAVAHPDLAKRFPLRTIALRGRLKALRVAAETTWLAAQVRRARLDVVWHPGGVVPPLTGGAAAVLTIHDLRPLDLPEGFSRTKVAYLRTVLPRSVRRAAVVTAPSQQVVAEIEDRFGVPADRLRAVPHGIGADLFDPVPPAEVDRVRAVYDLAGRWLLYPVITYPHKDHVTLVRAFARLAPTHPDVDLVLTGGEGPAEPEVARAIAASGVADRIRRTGRVPRADLDALLDGAVAVAFPSRYEGFGNGALEALAKGTPVVAADATSLPEVVGDGGLLVPPGDIGAWADALARVLDDDALAARLGAAGRVHAARFTDRAGAEELLFTLRSAADSGPGPAAG